MARVRVGIDVGGTFTDVLVADEDGSRLIQAKVPSTPRDPSEGILDGMAQGLEERRVPVSDVMYFAHGTTVATNTLLQLRGAKVGLITSAGFRDLLEIGRQNRPDLYDLQVDKPVPLVSRDLRLEVPERVYYDGRVLVPLDLEALDAVIERLRRAQVEAVAVCFLHGYVNPQHEAQVRERLQERMPETYLSISSEVLPEFREFERLNTTVVNAYVGPVISRYMARLQGRLQRDQGLKANPYISQSNGGLISLEEAGHRPVKTVLSGPSAGVMGAVYVGQQAGHGNIITFDMGGTSADVSLVQGGTPRLAQEREIAGYRIRSAMIDIHTVGAGGGSIAWQDVGGLLKVGPHSAGADPGPACYGRGGDEPTVTDANVVLGTLNPDYLLGGRMPIDAQLSRDVIDDLAGRLRLSRQQTASGIVSVVVANMVRAIRVVSVQRGHDPRHYTLVAFGGAGPLHAAWIARELRIPNILVPPWPGLLCAFGLLVSDIRTDFTVTRLLELAETSPEVVGDAFAQLEERGAAWLDREAIPPEHRAFRRLVDMRYKGQNYELTVEMPGGAVGPEEMRTLAESFHRIHEQAYGYASPDEPVQLVTFRVEAIGQAPQLPTQELPLGPADPKAALIGGRKVFLEGQEWDCPVYRREALQPGNVLEGPALVEQMDTTTLLLPNQRGKVDGFLNLILQEQAG